MKLVFALLLLLIAVCTADQSAHKMLSQEAPDVQLAGESRRHRHKKKADPIRIQMQDEKWTYFSRNNLKLPRLQPRCTSELHFVMRSSATFYFHDFHTLDLTCFNYQMYSIYNETQRAANGCSYVPEHGVYADIVDYAERRILVPKMPFHVLFSGSLNGLLFRVNRTVSLRIHVGARELYRCPVIFTTSLELYYSDRRSTMPTTTTPLVTGHAPGVAFYQKPSSFLFHYFDGRPNVEGTVIVPMKESEDICSKAADAFAKDPSISQSLSMEVSDLTLQKYQRQAYNLGWPHQTFFQWTHQFTAAGKYFICLRRSASEDFRAVAAFHVFGHNPAFFVSEDTNVDGAFVNKTNVQLKMFGEGLDTTKDQVLISDQTNTCDKAISSPTVINVSTLQPLLATSAENVSVTVSFSSEGLYRVCYKRAASGVWSEVPNLSNLPSMSKVALRKSTGFVEEANFTTAENATKEEEDTPAPIPTPVPNRPCPKTPTYYRKASFDGKFMLHIAFTTSRLPTSFFKDLAYYLCIPQEFLVQHAFYNKGTTSYGIFDIDCLDGWCQGDERMNYVLYAWDHTGNAELRHMGVSSVKLASADTYLVIGSEKFGSADASRSNDNSDGHHKSNKTLVIVVVVLSAALVAAIVAGAILYRRHKTRMSRMADLVFEADDRAARRAADTDPTTVVEGIPVDVQPRRSSDAAEHSPVPMMAPVAMKEQPEPLPNTTPPAANNETDDARREQDMATL